ncbi:MAG: HNH endonuclease [Actinomycetota bacterium]|nr:HNH endonuclease [Actinomycetota bacterium]
MVTVVNGGPGRTGSRWRKVQAECIANGALYNTPCVLCGLPIDYALTVAVPRHRLAGTVHHLIGLAQGGDPLDPNNLAPAHRSCNCRDGAHRYQHPELYQPVRNSRRW